MTRNYGILKTYDPGEFQKILIEYIRIHKETSVKDITAIKLYEHVTFAEDFQSAKASFKSMLSAMYKGKLLKRYNKPGFIENGKRVFFYKLIDEKI